MERRLLQIALIVFALVPIAAGGAGIWLGPALVGEPGDVSANSHFRYLSGLLLGIGLCVWAMVPAIERRTTPFRLICALVVIGGLARAGSLIVQGAPDAPNLAGLGMELVVTPLLCLWQARVAARAH